METCAFCPAVAESLPFVGVKPGDEPNVKVCADCQAKGVQGAKVHYMARADFDAGRGLHGVRQGPPPSRPYNSAKVSASLYFADVEQLASPVETAVFGVLRGLCPSLAGLNAVRAFRSRPGVPAPQCRVAIEAELPGVPADQLEEVLEPLFRDATGARRVDVQVWPIVR